MPKILIVGNDEFLYPEEGDNAGYGESATAWAEAVTTALQTVQQPNDVPVTTAAILNNIAIPTSILGFSFNTSEVIAISGEYIVRRTTDSQNLVQNGKIEGNFDGNAWNIVHEHINSAGISFDITSSGQITYTSTLITGTNYFGEIIFKAKVFNQPE